jgi:hypothetical protein
MLDMAVQARPSGHTLCHRLCACNTGIYCTSLNYIYIYIYVRNSLRVLSNSVFGAQIRPPLFGPNELRPFWLFSAKSSRPGNSNKYAKLPVRFIKQHVLKTPLGWRYSAPRRFLDACGQLHTGPRRPLKRRLGGRKENLLPYPGMEPRSSSPLPAPTPSYHSTERLRG